MNTRLKIISNKHKRLCDRGPGCNENRREKVAIRRSKAHIYFVQFLKNQIFISQILKMFIEMLNNVYDIIHRAYEIIQSIYGIVYSTFKCKVLCKVYNFKCKVRDIRKEPDNEYITYVPYYVISVRIEDMLIEMTTTLN